MWRVSQRNNSSWGIEGYDVPRKYFDNRKHAMEKELAALKPGKYRKGVDRYFCKKGHYLDPIFKSQTVMVKDKKQVYQPGPGRYLPTTRFKDELKDRAKKAQKPLKMDQERKDEIWKIEHDAKLPDL